MSLFVSRVMSNRGLSAECLKIHLACCCLVCTRTDRPSCTMILCHRCCSVHWQCAAGAALPQTEGSASEPSPAPSAPKLSIHARWQEESPEREQTFKDYWDALPPLRPVPGRTRSLQLPVYRRGHTHLDSIAGVRPFTLGEVEDGLIEGTQLRSLS